MNISEASLATGLPPKTIRYYEDIGLITPQRASNGYREFDGVQLNALRFLASARGLGFKLEECRQLLMLRTSPTRRSADVKIIAKERLADLDRTADRIEAMRTELRAMIEACPGNEQPGCAIIDGLSSAR
ncbi:MAG: MerR family transcriptional regulator [Pseudomonadota bacterium]